MAKTIYFDGLNIGMKRGTGVATYTRVLANLARQLGYTTGVLHALGYGLPRRGLEREVCFFDDTAPLPMPQALRLLGRAGAVFTSIAGVWPQRVERSGAVLTRQFESTWVESDRIYASHAVFDRARGLFMASGTSLRVRFPHRPDLFHWTYPLPMKANARANIYTVHDLVPVRLPYTTLDWKRYYVRSMRNILARADHIVTVSENSKRDIVELFGVDARRVTNTYQAIDIPRSIIDRPRDDIADELAGVFGLDKGKYLLFYGSLEPKKNVNRIVQAYLGSKVDIPLVVVVAQNWQSDEEGRLLNQILEEDKYFEASKERRRIRRYEYLPFRLLMTLVQGARAVVFPSLYEGFGLPILEAMTLGTPVITSNTSSTPEIAGDACLLVDPYKVEEIRKAIVTLSEDDGLCADLSTKGLVQAQKFSLERYRARMTEFYAGVV